MSRELANRLVFLLACIGCFIALVIGVAHWSGVQLPCGGVQSGCDVIGDPKHNQWFGIPIAFWGLGLYLMVAVGCMFRSAIGVENSPRIGSMIWVLLASGTVISIALVTYGKTRLDAVCIWCLASMITMSVAFLIHSLGMLGRKAGMRGMAFGIYAAVLAVALVSGGAYGYVLSQKAKHVKIDTPVRTDKAKIYLPTSHIIGDPNAKTTIVGFMDLYCPLCRKMHKWLEKELDGPLKGKVRLIIRHWPVMERHPHALTAAVLSEWAAEQGKFVEFIHAAQEIEEEHDPLLLIEAAKRAGLDPVAAERLMNDPSARQRYLTQISEDIGDANALGVESTPWWFIEYPDKTIEPTSGLGIQGKVESEAFKKRIQ